MGSGENCSREECCSGVPPLLATGVADGGPTCTGGGNDEWPTSLLLGARLCPLPLVPAAAALVDPVPLEWEEVAVKFATASSSSLWTGGASAWGEGGIDGSAARPLVCVGICSPSPSSACRAGEVIEGLRDRRGRGDRRDFARRCDEIMMASDTRWALAPVRRAPLRPATGGREIAGQRRGRLACGEAEPIGVAGAELTQHSARVANPRDARQQDERQSKR